MSSRFLIVKPSSLGDVLHAFPAVSALCRKTKGTADWLIHPAFAQLLCYLPCVERSIIFDRKALGSFGSFLPSYLKLRKELRQTKYDAVIDLQGLMRSAYFGSIAKAKIHAGPDDPREKAARFFYSKKIVRTPGQHAVVRNNEIIAGFLGLDVNKVHFSASLAVDPGFLLEAEDILAQEGIPEGKMFIGVAPGARWQSKCWPPTYFASVVKRLMERFPEAHVLLMGTNDEHPAAAAIRKLLDDPASATDLCGKTRLGPLVELIRKCSIFLCNDSGPMHIAAALNIPVVAPFGPTDPELTGPYSENSITIQPDLDCICCFNRVCPDMKCHQLLRPDTAANAAIDLMLNRKS